MGRRKKIVVGAETPMDGALQKVAIEINDTVVQEMGNDGTGVVPPSSPIAGGLEDENNEEDKGISELIDDGEDVKKPAKKKINKDYTDKLKETDKAINILAKQFGSDFIRRGAIQQYATSDVVPTGLLYLDWALGVGGIIGGRIYEIFGDFGTGKSCLTFSIIGEFQKLNKICCFMDIEGTFDPTFAKKFGTNVDNLLISQPDSMEQTFDAIYTLVKSGSIDLIVIDSAAALVPKKILEGEEKDFNRIGYDAQIMNKHLGKLNALLGQTKTAVIFINQIYDMIGDSYAKFKEPGTKKGKALKFYSTVRIEVQKKKTLKNKKGDVIGNTTTMIVRKNKTSIPMRKAKDVVLNYIKGYDKELDIISMALKFDVVTRKGAWVMIGDERINGLKVFRDLLLSNDKLRNDIIGKIRVKIIENKEMTGEDAEVDTDTKSDDKDDD